MAIAFEGEGEAGAWTACLSGDALQLVLSRLSVRELLRGAALVCRRWRQVVKECPIFELTPCRFAVADTAWGSLSANAVAELARHYSSNLQVLHLRGLSTLQGPVLVELLTHLPRLKELAVTGCPRVTAEDLTNAVALLPPNLEALDFHAVHELLRGTCVRCPRTVPLLTDGLLRALTIRCRNLGRLDLDDCSLLSAEAIGGFVAACPGLTAISLHSHSIGWPTVSLILSTCRSLEHLSVVSEKLQEQAPELPIPASLTSVLLYQRHHSSVDWDGASKIALLRKAGGRLRALYAERCYNAAWDSIGQTCGHLETLDISHAESWDFTPTEQGVAIGMLRCLPKLQRLGLPTANDAVLLELSRSCPLLRELRFQGRGVVRYRFQVNVTNTGVRVLAERCQQLRVLSLAGCVNITDSVLRTLAVTCSHLEVLQLTRCGRLEDAGLFMLLTKLHRTLTTFDVSGTRATEAFLDKVFDMAKNGAISLRVLSVGSLYTSSVASLQRGLPQPHRRGRQLQVHRHLSWDGFMHAPPGLSYHL